jgi:hypothetical protein
MDVGPITVTSLASVAELIDFKEALVASRDAEPQMRLAFRGQPREYGTLAPSFRRQFTRDSVGTATIIERRLIDAFREHYGALKDRSADMPQPARIGPSYDLRCLSVMQHYEIPTRLLDWTSSFWTAVYFACASESVHKAELWLYDRRLFEPQTATDPSLMSLLDGNDMPPPEPSFLGRRGDTLLVELDPRITPRMKQQSAHHTVSAHVFADHVPLLLALAGGKPTSASGTPLFQRVLIDSACKSKVLQYLAEQEGITASTIFPDVVGLGRFLRWQFDSLRTMML